MFSLGSCQTLVKVELSLVILKASRKFTFSCEKKRNRILNSGSFRLVLCLQNWKVMEKVILAMFLGSEILTDSCKEICNVRN